MSGDEQYDSDSTGTTGDIEEEEQVITEPKKKSGRIFTEKARQALTTGRESYNAMRRQRKLDNELKLEEQRQERLVQYEANIKKKAMAIRKREIKHDYLTLIEDDDTPDEIIQDMMKALKQRQNKTQIPQAIPQTRRVPQRQIPEFIFV